jgi:hypothetical protein
VASRRGSSGGDYSNPYSAPLDALMRLQQTMSRLTMPPDQLRAMTEGLARLVVPGQYLEAMLEIAEAFGPPAAQLAAMQDDINREIEGLRAMEKELKRIRSTLDRFTAAAERLAALQEPLANVARMFNTSTMPRPTEAQPGLGDAEADVDDEG